LPQRRKLQKKKRAQVPQEPVEDKSVKADAENDAGAPWETLEALISTDDSAQVSQQQDDTAQVGRLNG
jgi:hypothetical protein